MQARMHRTEPHGTHIAFLSGHTTAGLQGVSFTRQLQEGRENVSVLIILINVSSKIVCMGIKQ
jgi:hypothetical protein